MTGIFETLNKGLHKKWGNGRSITKKYRCGEIITERLVYSSEIDGDIGMKGKQ